MICHYCHVQLKFRDLHAHCLQLHSGIAQAQDFGLTPFQLRCSAFRGMLFSYSLSFEDLECRSIQSLFRLLRRVFNGISSVLAWPICFNIFIKMRFIREVDNGVETNEDGNLASHNFTAWENREIRAILDIIEASAETYVDPWTTLGSGRSLDSILLCEIHVSRRFTDRVGCGGGPAQIPEAFKGKIRDIRFDKKKYEEKEKNKCFQKCIIASLHPEAIASIYTPSVLKYISYLRVLGKYKWPTTNGKGVSFEEIRLFERDNNVGVRVFTRTDDGVFPWYFKRKFFKKEVYLLLESNHFYLIPRFHRLFVNKDNLRFRCGVCQSAFQRQSTLHDHQKYCFQDLKNVLSRRPATKINFPPPGTFKTFDSFGKTRPAIFICGLDFECTLVKGTTAFQTHQPNTFALYGCTAFDRSIFYNDCYSGVDCVQVLIQSIKRMVAEAGRIFSRQVKINPLTPEQRQRYHAAKWCELCGKVEFTEDEPGCADHYHFGIGDYLRRLCVSCNACTRADPTVYILVHNGGSYDNRFLIPEFYTLAHVDPRTGKQTSS